MNNQSNVFNNPSASSWQKNHWPELEQLKISPYNCQIKQENLSVGMFATLDILSTPPPSPNNSTIVPDIEKAFENRLPIVQTPASLSFILSDTSPSTPPPAILLHSPQSSPSSPDSMSSSLLVPQRKHKYRFTLADAPRDILDQLGLRDAAAYSLSAMSSSRDHYSRATSISHVMNHKNIERIRPRKNPYPMRAPSKSSGGITLQVDAFKPFLQDPRQLLQSNFEPQKTPSEVTFSSLSSTESSAPPSPRLGPKKLRPKKLKMKREGPAPPTERRRKGNSLARVMADRGLLESTMNPLPTALVNGEIKAVRIPPPPPMEFSDLMKELHELSLDNSLLEIKPKVSWKGGALNIQHLPHYHELQRNEAYVASVLRLTPVQYLTAKHSLVSASRRYAMRSLPFRKSDAQKLLRIDVNKASKLWEFFHQVRWI